MIRSDLIQALAEHFPHMQPREADQAVRIMQDTMTAALAAGQRIEIRGFGSFTLHERPARTGRNPRSGAVVQVGKKRALHFRPGKALREAVNASAEHTPLRTHAE